jgi:hypothetical protein
MFNFSSILFLLFALTSTIQAESAYEVGSPNLIEIYVDVLNGNDSNSGHNRDQPLRTVTQAWNNIPRISN